MKKLPSLIIFLLFVLQSVFAQIPSGYYNTATGLTGNDLRIALRDITKNGHVKLSYTPGVWNAYAYTDVQPAPNNTKIWDMYSYCTYTLSTNQCGTANSECDCYSREHLLPNSWWGGYDDATHPQYSDLHQLYPADQYVNNYKSAHPLGQVTNPSYTSTNGISKVGPCSYPGYTGTVFEPSDQYKGDFARALFYAATRYMDVIAQWVKDYPNTEAKYIIDTATDNYKQWFIDMLLQWHANDPVSTKEINRNNAVYYNTAQHNRNPYIDHPEYVVMVWAPQTLILPEPTNHVADFSAHNIHLQWTDATGTNLPDGYLILFSKTGYSAIPVPVDGVPVANGLSAKNVPYGVQEAWLNKLDRNTPYYIKMYPYKGSGSGINYKTDGVIPQTIQTTKP